MEPRIGDTLVHPQHGTTTVTGFEQRTIRGEEVEYVTLERPEDKLIVRIPRGTFAEAGLRPVIDEDAVAALFAVLDEDAAEKQGSWRKRHARNVQRVTSGDPMRTATALRDLHARYLEGGLSTTDMRLYRDARERLTDEIVAATGDDRAAVEAGIERALADRAQASASASGSDAA